MEGLAEFYGLEVVGGCVVAAVGKDGKNAVLALHVFKLFCVTAITLIADNIRWILCPGLSQHSVPAKKVKNAGTQSKNTGRVCCEVQ